MKLLGFHNNKQIVASITRHDYISVGEDEQYILADGGQPNIGDSAGYNKHWGTPVWFEIPQTYAELYNDWNNSLISPRKYGIWSLADVKILSPEEIPDTESFEWKAENAIWGTNGPNGDHQTTYVLLKDCSNLHLRRIADICKARGNEELRKIAEYWIEKRVVELTSKN